MPQHVGSGHVFVLLLVLTWALYCHAESVAWRYAVIIDAGSTGSRAHVFKYHSDKGSKSAYPVVDLPEAVHKSSPGLSSYASNPKAAADSLQPLLKFAKSKVPAGQWQQTPIQLMATAGLRMLNNGTADRIIAEVDKVLSASGFDYSPASTAAGGAGGARVLSGTEEGLLGWVALNYASGALQAATEKQRLGRKDIPKPASSSSSNTPYASPLQGVLELGGGSLQVTFMPSIPPPATEASPLSLPALGEGRLYSRSFDGVGLQAATAKWAADLAQRKQSHDPCLPTGFKAAAPTATAGSGNWGACKAGVVRLLPKGGPCVYNKCGLAGTFLPHVEGATFVGVDNVFYTASTLGLSTSRPTSLEALDKAASTFCGYSWSHIKSHFLKNHKGDPADAYHAKVCFSAALILSLLKEGLQLPPKQALLTATNNITTPKGKSLEAKWPLGALVVALVNNKRLKPVSSTTTTSSSSNNNIVIHNSHKVPNHPVLDSEEEGLSPGQAASVAALFCMAMLALSLCASWLGVGLPGNSGCGQLWQRLLRMHQSSSTLKLLAASGGGGAGGGDGGASSGSSSSVRYMRVRPSSGGAEAISSRPRSTSPQRRLVGGVGSGGEDPGAVMLTVMPAGAVEGTATIWSVEPRSSALNNNVANRPTAARQR